MKKLVSILMTIALIACLCTAAFAEAAPVKVGFIFLHDENSTYDLNFINAAKQACEEMGVEYVLITNIDEGQQCYDAAAELVEDEGCNIVFADSFGHESFMIQAPAPRRTPWVWTTTTTPSPPSMRAASWRASPPA